MNESIKIVSGQVIAMQCKKAWFICCCLIFITAIHWFDRNSSNALLAAPIPPDPSLDVSITVHGKFVNWETGERKLTTIEPQVLWALASELPTRTDLLRQAIKNEWRDAQLFQPKIWQQWQHRTFQPLKAPKNWLVWDVSDQPLELRIVVRDSKKRLTEAKLVTASEEATSKAREGIVQTIWRIEPTDSAVVILHSKTGVLAFLLVRWTPIVYAERVGIVADAGIVPVKVGRCEECEQGEAIARQVHIEFPQPEEGFVRVYRRFERGEPWPNIVTDLPHFSLKPSAWIIVGQSSVYLSFVRSIPTLSPQEAVKILSKEVRKGASYELPKSLPGQRGTVSTTRWEFYDVQRRRYVAVAWEVRVRYGNLPSFFSSYNEAAYRTRDIAQEIVKELPLSPPNDVAKILVERLRARVKEWRIGLMPRAALWFEGNVMKQWGEFYEPPPATETHLRRDWELRQQFVKFLREGKVPVKFSWRDERAGTGGFLKLKWVRWLKPEKRLQPQQKEWHINLSQVVLVPVNAEYEVEPKPPEGFSSVSNFKLTLETQPDPLKPQIFQQVPLKSTASDSQVRAWVTYHYTGDYPNRIPQLVVSVEIPLTLTYLWELRVTFSRTPVKGELKIILEGNGRRWEEKAIAELAGSWDIPIHPRWLFPDPRRHGVFIASDAAVFRLIPPGRYTLKVEGVIGGEASVNVSPFPGKPKIVTMREPIRQVRWQKRIKVKAGSVETIVVPLPR